MSGNKRGWPKGKPRGTCWNKGASKLSEEQQDLVVSLYRGNEYLGLVTIARMMGLTGNSKKVIQRVLIARGVERRKLDDWPGHTDPDWQLRIPNTGHRKVFLGPEDVVE